jgi:hypothetical protein
VRRHQGDHEEPAFEAAPTRQGWRPQAREDLELFELMMLLAPSRFVANLKQFPAVAEHCRRPPS